MVCAVDSLHACGSIGAVLCQCIWAAPDLAYSDQSKLPSSKVIQRRQLLGILLNENVGILLRRVLAAGRVIIRHEIVVQVVIAAYSNGVNALAQIICSSVFITEYAHNLRNSVPVVVYLSSKIDPGTLFNKKNAISYVCYGCKLCAFILDALKPYQLLAGFPSDSGSSRCIVYSPEYLLATGSGVRRDVIIKA